MKKTFCAILLASVAATAAQATDYYLFPGSMTQPWAGTVLTAASTTNYYWKLDAAGTIAETTTPPGAADSIFYTYSAASDRLLLLRNADTAAENQVIPIVTQQDGSKLLVATYANLTSDFVTGGYNFVIASNTLSYGGTDGYISSKLVITGTMEQKNTGMMTIRKANNSFMDADVNIVKFSTTAGRINFGDFSATALTTRNVHINKVEVASTAAGSTIGFNSAGYTEAPKIELLEVNATTFNIDLRSDLNIAATNIKANMSTDRALNVTLSGVTGKTLDLGVVTVDGDSFNLGTAANIKMSGFTQNGQSFNIRGGSGLTFVNSGDHVINNANARDIYANFAGTYTIAKDYKVTSGSKVTLRGITGGGNGLFIEGAINNMGEMLTDDYYNANATRQIDTSITAGGIKGGDGTSAISIHTTNGDVSTGEIGNLTLKLNGSATNLYSSRISDFDSGVADVSTVTAGSLLNLELDSADGNLVQYLTGQNYIRGSVAVKSGTLHLRADGADNDAGYGVGAITLSGGALGAVGAGTTVANTQKVGKIKAESLAWSGGKILVDINSAGNDVIELSGAFTKGAGSVFEIDFSVFDGIADGQYVILTFDSTDFTDSDFTALLKGLETDKITLEIKDGNKLVATLDNIPEPAEYAALFGLIALLFAIRRRRK